MHTIHVPALALFACTLALPLVAHAQGQAQAPTSASGLAACRGIAGAAARLACYDALPEGPTAIAAPAGPAAQPAGTSARPAGAAAPTAPTAAAAGAAGTAAAAAAVTATPAATAAASFGIERRAQAELQEISSRFEGDFDGWAPNSRIRLANGQVWQVADGSSAPLYLKSPRVTVKRALLGGYVMEFEGTNRTAKVRRVD